METGEHISKEFLRRKKVELDRRNELGEVYPFIKVKDTGVILVAVEDFKSLLGSVVQKAEELQEDFPEDSEILNNLRLKLKSLDSE